MRLFWSTMPQRMTRAGSSRTFRMPAYGWRDMSPIKGCSGHLRTRFNAQREIFFFLQTRTIFGWMTRFQRSWTHFDQQFRADIVVSDAALMNEDGTPTSPSYYANRGKFQSGSLPNVLHGRYLGCTMAFRNRIHSRILPFPKGGDIHHDLWIGTSNSLAGARHCISIVRLCTIAGTAATQRATSGCL